MTINEILENLTFEVIKWNTWVIYKGKRMTLGQLYRLLGVPRPTLYSWHSAGKLTEKTGAVYV